MLDLADLPTLCNYRKTRVGGLQWVSSGNFA